MIAPLCCCLRKNSFNHANFFYLLKNLLWLPLVKRVDSLQENINLKKVGKFQIYQKHWNFFGRSPPFWILKNSLKNAKFSGYCTFGGYFQWNESGNTSRKYVAEQGLDIPNLSETHRLFWFHCSVSATEK